MRTPTALQSAYSAGYDIFPLHHYLSQPRSIPHLKNMTDQRWIINDEKGKQHDDPAKQPHAFQMLGLINIAQAINE